MPSRPPAQPFNSSSSSTQIRHHPDSQTVHTLYPLFAQLTFHVVTAKLEEELGTLYRCIEQLGGKSVGIQQARFIVSALRGRPRLIRAIGELIDVKPILAVEYIHDTFQIALDHANSLSETPPSLPSRDQYIIKTGAPTQIYSRRLRPEDEDEVNDRPNKRQRVDRQDNEGDIREGEMLAIDYLPDLEPYPVDIRLQDIPKMCVLRPSPLICVNQDIIEAIKPIYLDREFESSEQKNSNVLSYRRSMSILKAVPRRIRSGKEARKLVDVGEKVAQRIDEYLTNGFIEESDRILSSSRHKTLSLFVSVFTIGHHTALELYDRHNCRTLEDVRLHYQMIAEESEEMRIKEKLRRRREGGMTKVDIVEEWLQLGEDLAIKIPRKEVIEIAACVMEHLSAFIPGCQYTLTGGYRRGKTESNDVDIVFCPPEHGQDIGLLRDLYIRLGRVGIITHVLQVTSRDPDSPIHASANNFDNLDKAFVIFKLPGMGRLHRRVDLISAPKDRYAAAVLSWSGSMMFERDLRRYAEERGYKFRAGLIRVSTGEEIKLETEREIFHYLGLQFVPPELRNADG